MRSAVVAWAEENGVPSEARAVLASAAPRVARAWAERHEVPEEVLTRPRTKSSSVMRVVGTEWATAEIVDSIDAAVRVQGRRQVERNLLSRVPASVDDVEESGVNETLMVEFDDGTRGFHKSFAGLDTECAEDYGQIAPVQPIHEAAAWRVAAKLGPRWQKLVPVCVIKGMEGRVGSLAAGVPGDVGEYSGAPLGTVNAAAFFDAVIGQQDRHSGNILTDGSDLYLIHHGFSFATNGDYCNASMFVDRRYQIGDRSLSSPEVAAIDRLLSSKDLYGLERILEPARSDALRYRLEGMRERGLILPRGEY